LNSLSTQQAFFGRTLHGVKGVLGGLAAVLLVSCAGVAPRKADVVVKERAQARWNALVNGDFNAAYGYFSPGSRSVLSATDYASSLRRGFWKSAVVEKVECGSAQSCEVSATIEYEHMGMRTKTPLKETWIRDGSEWWYLKR
jgi:hypothetical protein